MSTEPKHFLSAEQYLELDAEAERPSEYLDGAMVEVEASSPNHGLILSNLTYSIADLIRKNDLDCEVRPNTLRVFMPAVGLYAYPDIVITCGDEEYGPTDTLLNPALLIEVLSPTTENYDTGKKFEYYRSIPSLHDYITVAQDGVNINHWQILNGKWTLIGTHTELADSLLVLGRPILLGEIYRHVFNR
jgi:Uma2 family endonuclease